MLILSPIEADTRVQIATAHALAEETRRLRARAFRLIEKATELVVHARALQADRIMRVARCGSAPCAT